MATANKNVYGNDPRPLEVRHDRCTPGKLIKGVPPPGFFWWPNYMARSSTCVECGRKIGEK